MTGVQTCALPISGSHPLRAGAEEQGPRLLGAVPWGPSRVRPVPRERAIPPASPLLTSVAVADVLRPLFAGLGREQFLVCGLDAKHCIIGVNIVSIGSLTLAIVHPREVFKPLILMNACAWICAHNHPSAM